MRPKIAGVLVGIRDGSLARSRRTKNWYGRREPGNFTRSSDWHAAGCRRRVFSPNAGSASSVTTTALEELGLEARRLLGLGVELKTGEHNFEDIEKCSSCGFIAGLKDSSRAVKIAARRPKRGASKSSANWNWPFALPGADYRRDGHQRQKHDDQTDRRHDARLRRQRRVGRKYRHAADCRIERLKRRFVGRC